MSRTPAQRAAGLRRRVRMIKFHCAHRGEDGKSIVAQRGGRARMGDDPAMAKATATEMAVSRWYRGQGGRRQRQSGRLEPADEDVRQ